jgi:serine protease AprX
MPIEIPSSLVEFVLLGPEDDRRQLQDSPILGDVWVAFARGPDEPLDLLITPYMTLPAGRVATIVEDRFATLFGRRQNPDIAYLQGIIAARLTFPQLLRTIVPITKWWADKYDKDEDGNPRHEVIDYAATAKGRARVGYIVQKVLASAVSHFVKTTPQTRAKKETAPAANSVEKGSENGLQPPELTPLDRYVVLTGLILWAAGQKEGGRTAATSTTDKAEQVLTKVTAHAIGTALTDLFKSLSEDAQKKFRHIDAEDLFKYISENLPPAVREEPHKWPMVWQVSRNRTATLALTKSIPAVKADAANFLFKVNCSEITWAVIDSGIDGTHRAFLKPDVGEPQSDGSDPRVKRSFDFRNFRKIVSLSNSNETTRKKNLDTLLELKGLLINERDEGKDKKELLRHLSELSEDARRRGAIHWDLVEKFVEINPETRPDSNHGTHVAGIIGASKKAADPDDKNSDAADGMCPDINLYDFRVLGPNMKDTEFAIIAVLQYIRWLNDRDNFYTIHGANLSLSIPHDVRNFACGRTPICNECERLSNSGVVVVAAAGNHGYKSFETRDGSFDSYAAFSITDPGNADDVITVGATHRYWPHTYGVSFFSSRGPTGDGRLKPDLVAPGERIRAPFPNGDWGDLDGTSMAAPHVSGAAAMLLARYSELIGQPRRVKQILCDTATDLGRERSFQGHGMLDVLRAFQSI